VLFIANVSIGVPLGVTAAFAVGNTLEAVVGAWFLRKAGFKTDLARARDVGALTVWAALTASAIAATVGAAAGFVGGVVDADAIVSTWRSWWLGDALGMMIIAPPIWLTARMVRAGVGRTRKRERPYLGSSGRGTLCSPEP